jgi:hypothetical protein
VLVRARWPCPLANICAVSTMILGTAVVALHLLTMVLVGFSVWWSRKSGTLGLTGYHIFVLGVWVYVWFLILENFLSGQPELGILPTLAVTLAVISVSLAYLATLSLTQRLAATPGQFRPARLSRYEFLVFFGLACITSFVFYRTVGGSIWGVLAGTQIGVDSAQDLSEAVSVTRFEATKAHYFRGGLSANGVLKDLQAMMWLFLAVRVFLFDSSQRVGWFWRAAVVAGLIYSVGGTGERAPVAWAMVFLAMVLSTRRKLSPKVLMWVTSAVIVLLFLLTSISSRGSRVLTGAATPSEILLQLGDRAIRGNGVHDLQVIGWVSEGRWSLGYGRWHREKALSSLPGVSVGVPMGFQVSQEIGSPGRVFSSGTYLSFAYADLGLLGVVLGFAACGIALGLADRAVSVSAVRLNGNLRSVALLSAFFLGRSFSNGILGFASYFVVILTVLGVAMLIGASARTRLPALGPSQSNRGWTT